MENQQETHSAPEKESGQSSPLQPKMGAAGGASLPPPPLNFSASQGMPIAQRQEDPDAATPEDEFMESISYVVHPMGGPAERIFTGDLLYIWADVDWDVFYTLSFEAPPMVLSMEVTGPEGPVDTGNLQTDLALPTEFQADYPGTYTITATIRFDPHSPNQDHTVSSTFTLESREQDAIDAVSEVDPVPYDDFRTGMEINSVVLAQGGVEDQNFAGNGNYISLTSGANPGTLVRGVYVGNYSAEGFANPEATRWYALIADPTRRTEGIMNNTGGEADAATYDRMGVASDAILYNILDSPGAQASYLMFDPGSHTILAEGYTEAGEPSGEVARYLQVVLSNSEQSALDNQEEYINEVDSSMEGIPEGSEIALRAVYIPNDTLQPQALNMYLGPNADDGGYILMDGTPIALGESVSEVSVRRYTGDTLAAVFTDFDQHNEYPDGTIAIEIPENDLGLSYTVPAMTTNGAGILREAANAMGIVGAGLMLGSFILPILAIPGGLMMAGSGYMSLQDNLRDATRDGTAITMDLLTIASGLIGAGSATRYISSNAQQLWYNGGQYVQLAGFAIDGVQTVIVNVQGLDRIGDILGDDTLDREAKIRGVAEILVQLAITDLIFGLQVRGEIQTQNRINDMFDDALLDTLSENQRFRLANFPEPSLQALATLDQTELVRILDVATFNYGAVASVLPGFASMSATARADFLTSFPDNQAVAQIFQNWSQFDNTVPLFDVLAMDRGSRPADPASYLGQDYVDAQMQAFTEQGAAFVITPDAISDPSYATLAPQKYVLLRSDMDAIIANYRASGNDIAVLESSLGYGPGFFSGSDVYVVYLEPGTMTYSMPTGNELGANQWWLPGGMTPNGGHEATIQGPPIVHNNDINTILNNFPHEQLATATTP